TWTVTFDDPDTWLKPWTVEIPLRHSDDGLIEYACHEGNYGMQGILAGARAADTAEAAERIGSSSKEAAIENWDFLPGLSGKVTTTISVCEYEAGLGRSHFVVHAKETLVRAKRDGHHDQSGVRERCRIRHNLSCCGPDMADPIKGTS